MSAQLLQDSRVSTEEAYEQGLTEGENSDLSRPDAPLSTTEMQTLTATDYNEQGQLAPPAAKRLRTEDDIAAEQLAAQ